MKSKMSSMAYIISEVVGHIKKYNKNIENVGALAVDELDDLSADIIKDAIMLEQIDETGPGWTYYKTDLLYQLYKLAYQVSESKLTLYHKIK